MNRDFIQCECGTLILLVRNWRHTGDMSDSHYVTCKSCRKVLSINASPNNKRIIKAEIGGPLPPITTRHTPAEFGTHREGGVDYCNRCGCVSEFPTTKIRSNVYSVGQLKTQNFRVIERKSWQERKRSRYVHTDDGYWMETVREDADSCMNCNHARGYDCDEPWTENRCTHSHLLQIAPYTICDLHGKEVKWSREERQWVVVGDYDPPWRRKKDESG